MIKNKYLITRTKTKNIDDGDQFGFWVNDEMLTVLTGSIHGEGLDSTGFGFGGRETQLITLVLHSTEEVNSQVIISNITINSVKQEIIDKVSNQISQYKPLRDFQVETNLSDESLLKYNLKISDEMLTFFPGAFGVDDTLKEAELAYNNSDYEKAYAYGYYSRAIMERIVERYKLIYIN